MDHEHPKLSKTAYLHSYFSKISEDWIQRRRLFSFSHSSGRTKYGYIKSADDMGITILIINKGWFKKTLEYEFVFYEDITGYIEDCS